ncbi:tubulin polyglutamylase TTLL5 [Stomoxys calcitrans]|uniref:Tubulin--tyrosine ligase-like protein 5 n=1 Tax=Stomoxys calcitrans TaxID=35570 RepID=A0A1I8PWW9_STOCA|nr:tubulin polyglutamylase TTLL5 [Stomoxys calcitrans]XP_013102278.1 tubulin polyglutamylase TTLL5 [Stomoxys calcitrans]XP_013102279.1 tubulin polyglutamylase TTLL5 [Stomoxys calcitrans]XP_013102280.1 tubulin polyglutamylase TTLL5 [Stomoxys calcitrans]XP_059220729.1 tubulin polyglutamylase TTLL5 [Stomoxys calcitrans]XP_059220731.1 tubulin polyglutamylase TTLL5 [Stomoxys calcitrans]
MPTTDARPNNNVATTAGGKRYEKPRENEWITSGALGSRDAVLVFRTTVLNCSRPQQQVARSDSGSSVKDVGVNEDPALEIYHHKQNEKSKSTSSLSTVNAERKSLRNEAITSTQRRIGTHIGSPGDKQKRCLVSLPKHLENKKLWDSMSSSDNSISSDGNDSEDNEKDRSSPGASKRPFQRSLSNHMTAADPDMENDNENENEHDADGDDHAPALDMPATNLKLTYKFLQTETKLLRKIFARHGLTEAEEDESFSILWTGVHMKPDMLRNLSPYQRVNHFPRSYELTRKDRLYKNIERMQHLRGMKHFDIVPQSFLLPLEYKDLVTAHNKCRGPWIVKPAASSRGRGIFIVNSPDQIPQDEQVLVSKYVADPLCIDGHKCDLRVYVLVTSFDPLIIYLYEEGLVRLATVKYDLDADNLWNPCMHLCNYSINKYHTDYIKSSDAHEEDVGHKWTLSALLRHLKSQGCDTNLLIASIEDLIIKSIFSCAQTVISACRMFVPNGSNCFELYGFDILIDDTLKPWLLEVNLSPSMGVDSPLDAKVKSCLITDLLTCVGIPAYTPTMRAHFDSRWTRFRSVSHSRRTNSAEPTGVGNGAVVNTTVNKRSSVSTSACKNLTLEEQRIVRNARFQNARRGGFVRIFPTEDSMSRYGNFLDSVTGIPMSTPVLQGQSFQAPMMQHNYNQLLYQQLYGGAKQGAISKEGNSFEERIRQYERVLETSAPILFDTKRVEPKCEEEGKRLRKQVLKLIQNGSELTQLQARQSFSTYLEAILRRLVLEPKDSHEKIILKFLNRVGGAVKAPVYFRNPQNFGVVSKARSAMVAKLLGDFLDQYNRDTEAYVDSFDHIAMIPTSIFLEFLSQAQEADLEAVLGLHTSLTGTMPFLYNRCGISVPPTPPIPSGLHGFLKALPAMVLSGSAARDFNKTDAYYRPSMERDATAPSKKDQNRK